MYFALNRISRSRAEGRYEFNYLILFDKKVRNNIYKDLPYYLQQRLINAHPYPQLSTYVTPIIHI